MGGWVGGGVWRLREWQGWREDRSKIRFRREEEKKKGKDRRGRRGQSSESQRSKKEVREGEVGERVSESERGGRKEGGIEGGRRYFHRPCKHALYFFHFYSVH